MSEANVALVRRMYEMINSIGRTSEFVDPVEVWPELWDELTPDFELHERPDLPDAKAYRGRDEAAGFWRKSQELFSELHWQVGEIIDLGEVVVVVTRVAATGRGSDVPIEADEIDVFWFRGGRLAKLQGFPTKEEALEAAREKG